MPGTWDPLEKYYSDEEDSLRKRGIDPMQVEQVEPPKLPTHPGNTTLHRGKYAKKTPSFKKGGMVKGRDYSK
jgi:hypothetical protein